MVVCGDVWLYVVKRGCMWQCGCMWGNVVVCVVMCGCMCGDVWLVVW